MREFAETFGIHETASGIRYLAQGGGVSHALDVPFSVPIKLNTGALRCPHNIALSNVSETELSEEHPLIKAFMPIPSPERTPIFLDETPGNLDLVVTLLRLTSANAYGHPRLLWTGAKHINPYSTNIQPLVLTGLSASNLREWGRMNDMVDIIPRRMVVLAPTWFAKHQPGYIEGTLPFQWLKTLPLEQIGAQIARTYLRHEPLPAWAA